MRPISSSNGSGGGGGGEPAAPRPAPRTSAPPAPPPLRRLLVDYLLATRRLRAAVNASPAMAASGPLLRERGALLERLRATPIAPAERQRVARVLAAGEAAAHRMLAAAHAAAAGVRGELAALAVERRRGRAFHDAPERPAAGRWLDLSS